jgi:hypothetical protein
MLHTILVVKNMGNLALIHEKFQTLYLSELNELCGI